MERIGKMQPPSDWSRPAYAHHEGWVDIASRRMGSRRLSIAVCSEPD